MNRENVLFSVVGLLLGYVVAFHLVVYVNQNQAAVGAADGQAAEQSAGAGGADRQRLLAEAEKAADEARQAPDNFDLQVRAAEAHFRAGSFEDAIDFMTRANRLRPDDYGTVVNLGQVYSAAGRFEDAGRWFKAALDKRPDDCEVRSELAYTFYKRQPSQPAKAVEELRRCLQSDPNNTHGLSNLAYMLLETKQLDEAESALARLEKIDPAYEQLPRLRDELRKARAGTPSKAPAD